MEALDEGGPLAGDDLAEATDADADYVAKWLDAAYAFDLLEADGSTFRLTELGEKFLPDAPGTLMPLAIQSVLSARLADRLSELLHSGEQPGEEIIEEFDSVTPWFGRMLEGKFRPYFCEHVLPELEVFDELAGRLYLAQNAKCSACATSPNMRWATGYSCPTKSGGSSRIAGSKSIFDGSTPLKPCSSAVASPGDGSGAPQTTRW